jgi:hypothetical protein
MTRPFSPAADELLNKLVPVLDHGLVMPLDYMGTDNEIVQSARVTQGPSAKPLHDDRGLLRYMMRHRHTTPFEMCEVRFKCRMPIFVARLELDLCVAVVPELHGLGPFTYRRRWSTSSSRRRKDSLAPFDRTRIRLSRNMLPCIRR